MNLLWHTPYKKDGSERYKAPVWPEGWPLPPLGTNVETEDGSLKVDAIDFYPEGVEGDNTPFVYVVLREIRLSA